MILGVTDIIQAAFLALFLTWFIGAATRIFKFIITQPTELGYNPRDLETVIQKCSYLFPIESIIFNGATVSRGMTVRAVTSRKNKTIEGRFVGSNRENIICFVTPEFVVAHELNDIRELQVVKQ